LSLTVAILAGGYATRIKSISDHVPKSLIEINGKPFLEWQLELLEKNGISRVVLCVSHKAKQIEEYIATRKIGDLEIHFSHDGKSQLGTGGSIVNALDLLREEFVVIYGDSYLPIDYNKIINYFKDQGLPALMTVKRNKLSHEKNNVIFKKGKIELYDKAVSIPKMKHIDFGLSIFKAKSFEKYKKGDFLDLSVMQNESSILGILAGYEVFEPYYEVGSFQGIENFRVFTKGLS
jgi:NDP-sugar pyrophosphorylase family protein